MPASLTLLSARLHPQRNSTTGPFLGPRRSRYALHSQRALEDGRPIIRSDSLGKTTGQAFMISIVRFFRGSEQEGELDELVGVAGASSSWPDPGDDSRPARWRRFACEVNGGPPPAALYTSLLARARRNTSASRTHKQIEKDLNRTFGSLKGLRVPPQEALQKLRDVLQAFAEHNPQVAYCQSMNFLAAVLLLVVDEESAFWCLAAIVERLMPGHFSTSMAMCCVDQGVLSELLHLEDRELVAHLEGMQVAPSLVTTQWLLTCFVGSALPLAALLSLWDAFFERRHVSFLFRVAAALLTTNRDTLLATRDTGDAYRLLTSLGERLADPASIDALLAAADALPMGAILDRPESLAKLRMKHAERLETSHSFDASQVAKAAVATATATDAELLAAKMAAAAAAAAGGSVLPGDASASGRHAAAAEGAGAAADAALCRSRGGVRGGDTGCAAAHEAAVVDWRTGGVWSMIPTATAAQDNPQRAVSAGGGGAGGGGATTEPNDEWEMIEPLAKLAVAAPPAVAAPRATSLSYVILQLEAPTLLEGHFGDQSQQAAGQSEDAGNGRGTALGNGSGAAAAAAIVAQLDQLSVSTA